MANDEEGRAEHGAKEQTKRSAGGTNWWRIRLGRLIWAQHRTYGSSSEVHEVDAGSGCRTSPEPWTKLWLSISVVVVLLTAGMVSGCGRGDESNGKNDGNTEQKQAADAEQKRLANIEHNRLAQISLRYWQSLDQIGCPIPGSRRDSNALAEGEEAAKKIEAMSVSEVDPEIINFARDTAQLCRRWGQFVDDHWPADFSREPYTDWEVILREGQSLIVTLRKAGVRLLRMQIRCKVRRLP